jgi:hypothetical protein
LQPRSQSRSSLWLTAQVTFGYRLEQKTLLWSLLRVVSANCWS